ncbi:uncharacterized protein N7458_002540 [Penicillium daleae]|uniref:Uncharacterized protein n=1 Tax=Penicillium daleae TaxID=63821 RepID=A0AAD6G782_9EURO|nr:uncharacterized protein N7458_002540 [Penicillium daleae]KAJ5460988.1 hypothetical protein N7458_002540 [Penicillium daleae]
MTRRLTNTFWTTSRSSSVATRNMSSNGNTRQGGYLSQHQNRLSGLFLVTDAWESIQHPKEVEYLQQCIDRNSGHLTDLSIGFLTSSASRALRWESFGSHQPEGTFSEDRITGQLTPILPLSALSLSKVALPLEPSVNGFMFTSLRALTLRDSAFLLSFRGLKSLYLKLTNFPTGEVTIQDAISHHRNTLKSLVYHERELEHIDDDGLFEDDRDVMPHWIPCLSDVVNLSHITSLALCASPASARQFLWPEARKMQLQILHLRFSGPENIHRNIRQDIEALLNNSHYKGISVPVVKDDGEYSACVDEICFALPPRHYTLSEPTMKNISLFEAEEFLKFAEWAFGPNGLPNLRVLAFGDFSHEDRYPSQQFLVRRLRQGEIGQSNPEKLSTLSFSSANVTDPWIWDGVVVDGSKFIGACPGGGVMESPYDI